MAQNRFFSHIERIPFSECWIWTGATTKGYGQATYNKQHGYAHRISWEIHNNSKIQPGKVCCHKCDEPLCVNPNHLFIGDHKDNVNDKIQKGRHRHGTLSGEQNGFSKVTKEIVEEIKLLKAKGLTVRQIAEKIGISKSNVWLVATNKTWN